MRRVLIGLSVAASVLLVSSCADPTTPANEPTTVPPTTAGSAPSSPVPVPPTASKNPGRQVTLEGVPEAGVEPGCTVLKTASGQYLLLGDVPVGVSVRVTGVLAVGVSTTCQQGTPLRVVTVQRK